MSDSHIDLGFANLKYRAKQLIEKKDWISAHNTLIQMQELAPNNYKLLIKLGNIYEKLNNFFASKWYYTKAITHKPNNDEAYFNLAKLYMNYTKYIHSKQYFINCLQIDNEKAVTNFHYAQLLFRMNDIPNAFIHYRKAVIIKPYIANYHYFVGKTALLLNTLIYNDIANTHLAKAIQLTNKNEIKYINEYVIHWRKWTWNHNILSVAETIHYLYLYAVNSHANNSKNIEKEYINLCTHILENQNNKYDRRLFRYFRRFSIQYKLKVISRASRFDPLNSWFAYEKYQVLDKLKYGVYNSDNIMEKFSKKNFVNRKEQKEESFLVSNIIESRCKSAINGYVSHSNLGIDKSVIIPYDIQVFCLKYLIDTKYVNRIDEFAISYHGLHFNYTTKQENIEMLFDGIFLSKCNKIIFNITKILNYIRTRKKARLLCCYYILYLSSFINMTSMSLFNELIKFDKLYAKIYCDEIILLPFQSMLSLSYSSITIEYQFVTELIISDERFYKMYVDFVNRQSSAPLRSRTRMFAALEIKIESWKGMTINTMRFVMGPLFLKHLGKMQTDFRSLMEPMKNIKLLEEFIVSLDPRFDNGKYQIALYWLQLESNWNNIISMDKIIFAMWMYLIRTDRINKVDCSLLKSLTNNENIYLKPSELSWVSFFDIFQSQSIVRSPSEFVDILKHYCTRQMSKDTNNEDNWKHCISLLCRHQNSS